MSAPAWELMEEAAHPHLGNDVAPLSRGDSMTGLSLPCAFWASLDDMVASFFAKIAQHLGVIWRDKEEVYGEIRKPPSAAMENL
jgi:hypothetical protein